MSEHTPTPWHWEEEPAGAVDKEALVSADGTRVLWPVTGWDRGDVGIRTGDWPKKGEDALPKANAAFIVLACNAHDALVEAVTHLKACGACAEDGLHTCEGGRAALFVLTLCDPPNADTTKEKKS